MKYAACGLLFASCMLLGSANAETAALHWQVLDNKSSIEWSAVYSGKEVKGTLPDFTADIVFSPEHLDTSHVSVKVAMAKVKSDDRDAQENLPTGDWFAAAQYPLAIFEADSFAHTQGDGYEAKGTLSLRGKSMKVTLPFTAKFYDDKDAAPSLHYARIMGETTLKRLDFGIGQGDWAKTDAVADSVKIIIHLEAKQVP